MKKMAKHTAPSYSHCVQGALLCIYLLWGEMKKEMTPRGYEVTLFNEYWKACKGYSNCHAGRTNSISMGRGQKLLSAETKGATDIEKTFVLF